MLVPVLLALTPVFSAAAFAAPADEAEKIIQRGRELMLEQKYDLALREFLAARALAWTPRVMVQIGVAEKGLEHWVDAEQHLVEAIAAPDDPWVKKYRALVDETLAQVRTHLASLMLRGTPAEAIVKIDGSPVAILPFLRPMRLVVGQVQLEVSAAGYETRTWTIALKPGESVDTRVDLQRSRPSQADTALLTQATPPPMLAQAAPGDRATRLDNIRTFSWWTLAGGTAAVAAGLVLRAYGSPKTGSALAGGGGGGVAGAIFGLLWFSPDDTGSARQAHILPAGAALVGRF
jgi:hypothetical protein